MRRKDTHMKSTLDPFQTRTTRQITSQSHVKSHCTDHAAMRDILITDYDTLASARTEFARTHACMHAMTGAAEHGYIHVGIPVSLIPYIYRQSTLQHTGSETDSMLRINC